MRQVLTTLYKFEELRTRVQEKILQEFMKGYQPISYCEVLECSIEHEISIEESANVLRAHRTPREHLILSGDEYLYDGTLFEICNSDS